MQKVKFYSLFFYKIFLTFFRGGCILATPTGGKLDLRVGVHVRRKAE